MNPTFCFMKPVFTLSFLCLLFISHALVAQVQNGYFEQWQFDASTNKMVAEGWNSPGFEGCFLIAAMAEQVTNAHEGAYAIGISTQHAGIAGIPMAGWFFNGDLFYDHNHNPVPLGSPITTKPSLVSFAYKYESDFSDQYGYVKIELFAGNQVVGNAESALYATSNRWEEFNISLNYPDPTITPDRVLIQFFSNPVDDEYTGETKYATLSIDKLSFETLAPAPCEEQLAVAYDADAKKLHVHFESCQFLGGTCLVGFCGTGLTEEEMGYYFTTNDPHFEVLDLQGRVRFAGRLDIVSAKTIFNQINLEPGVYVARVLMKTPDGKQQLNEVKFLSGK